MKLPLPAILFTLIAGTASAQQFDLKINAGGNLTMMPGFQNQIYIVDRFAVPGWININNAYNQPIVTKSASKTSAGIGYNIEAEVGKKLGDKWKLSLSVGLMQLRYNYDTYISQSFYKNDFYLGDVNDKYGESKFTYLTSRPLNVTRLFNRFSVQAGPVLSFLLDKKYINTVVIYDQNTGEAAGAFFEEKGDAQKVLFGAHLNTRYAVVKNLEVMLGAQYFFNSVYKSEGTYEGIHDKSKPLQFQLGLSYNFASMLSKAR
jgi:hypothetical protein